MTVTKHLIAFLPCGIMLFAVLAGARARDVSIFLNAPPQNDPSKYAARVKPTEATFSMLVPSQPKWSWRRPETKDSAQEYRMDVSVTNDGRQFNFGFYLWKFPGAKRQSGDLSELIRAGQASVFERAAPNRNVRIMDADIKLKLDGNRLVITIRGRDDIKRLFSGHPPEATFKITTPDTTPLSETISIVYQN